MKGRGVVVAAVVLLAACSGEDVTRAYELECDAGEECADAGGSASVYRVAEARLLDPHMYADPILVGCSDVTNHAPAGRSSANDTIEASLTADGDGDGFVDLGVLLELRPDDPEADSGRLRVLRALCDESNPAECQIDPTRFPVETTFVNQPASTCLEPDADVLSPADYLPPVSPVEPVCFVAEPVDLHFEFDETAFTLVDARVAAQYGDGVLDGLVIGFLSRDAARETSVNGKPMTRFLPDGDAVCAPHDDTDEHSDQSGWWFHFDFVAEPAQLVGPPPTFVEGNGCAK